MLAETRVKQGESLGHESLDVDHVDSSFSSDNGNHNCSEEGRKRANSIVEE